MYDMLQYGHQSKDGLDLIERVPLRQGMNVLDLGCGTGYLASIIASEIGERGSVTAVDPGKERLNIAKKSMAFSRM